MVYGYTDAQYYTTGMIFISMSRSEAASPGIKSMTAGYGWQDIDAEQAMCKILLFSSGIQR